MSAATKPVLRFDWRTQEVVSLFELPFNELLFQAASVHRAHFNPNEVQVSTLLSIKTGACPEDCKYCPQSAHYNTGLEKERLMELKQVVQQAKAAKDAGASRFCMGAAYRSPTRKDFPYILEMVKQVKSMGMETCMTLGMLDAQQASQLAEVGLDYYNHNLDTSPEFYGEVITTRSYSDRLQTLQNVREAGMKVCSGGILGLGEGLQDRAGLLVQLANMNPHPESVPVNMLVKVEGTPYADNETLDPIDFIRAIAVARIMMPTSHVRLSAGRETMSDETQALAFFAGANSIFYGEKLLTTANPEANQDRQLFQKLGIVPENQTVTPEGTPLEPTDIPHNCPKNNHRFYDATAVSQ